MVQTTKEVQMVQSCNCCNCLEDFVADINDTKPRCPRCGLSMCHCILEEKPKLELQGAD